MYSELQEMRLGGGHWVLVETLSGTYATRDEARQARKRVIKERRAESSAVWSMWQKLRELGYTAPENN